MQKGYHTFRYTVIFGRIPPSLRGCYSAVAIHFDPESLRGFCEAIQSAPDAGWTATSRTSRGDGKDEPSLPLSVARSR